MTRYNKKSFRLIFIIISIIMIGATHAYGASVSLQWDANDPTPQGYRVFVRENSQSYDYAHPIWENTTTTCTLSGLVEGVTYHFVVRAFEGSLESADSAEVSYTPVVTGNQAPVAEAGDNQSVYEEATVTLNGTASSDADGNIVAYLWEQTDGGTAVALSNATTAQASFTAPIVGLSGEILTFSLTVTDDDGETSADTVTIRVLKSSTTDVDGDGVPDVLDPFPEDPSEWADNDTDGIGDNADTDDDNDGMPDVWESEYGFNPLVDDADMDSDGDGKTNLEEYEMGTDPTTYNQVPDTPAIQTLSDPAPLTPVLVSGAFSDPDGDEHAYSRWQISTQSDFSMLTLDSTCETQLTSFAVGELFLDVDTHYYWRVRYIDSRGGASDWSGAGSFTTIPAEQSDDVDFNGIPDSLEVDDSVDVNEDGTPDSLEDDIMTFHSVEGETIVGVETVSEGATLVAVESIPTAYLSDQSVAMSFGLVGFKLFLDEGVTSASVTIHFSKAIEGDGKVYKYMIDTGWENFTNVVFSPDGKSVTINLEDGGWGDDDGVQNGVIVDPTGIEETSSSATISTGEDTISTVDAGAESGGGGGCFISAGIDGFHASSCVSAKSIIIMLGALTMIILRIRIPQRVEPKKM